MVNDPMYPGKCFFNEATPELTPFERNIILTDLNRAIGMFMQYGATEAIKTRVDLIEKLLTYNALIYKRSIDDSQ